MRRRSPPSPHGCPAEPACTPRRPEPLPGPCRLPQAPGRAETVTPPRRPSAPNPHPRRTGSGPLATGSEECLPARAGPPRPSLAPRAKAALARSRRPHAEPDPAPRPRALRGPAARTFLSADILGAPRSAGAGRHGERASGRAAARAPRPVRHPLCLGPPRPAPQPVRRRRALRPRSSPALGRGPGRRLRSGRPGGPRTGGRPARAATGEGPGRASGSASRRAATRPASSRPAPPGPTC